MKQHIRKRDKDGKYCWSWIEVEEPKPIEEEISKEIKKVTKKVKKFKK